MAFPTTGILDAFNRADQDPAMTGWSGLGLFGGTSQIGVTSNQLAKRLGGTGFTSDYFTVATYGPDCEAYITIPVLPAGATDEVVFLGARIATPGSGTCDGYFVYLERPTTLQLYRVDNGGQTGLGSAVTLGAAIAAGDSVGIECIGSSIKAYYKQAAGAWTQQQAVTDATYSAAGNIGLEIFGTTTRLDDLGGGNVAASTAGRVPFTSRRAARALLRR
jgi:hypothetical protein